MAVFGPDGIGKSAVIEALPQHLGAAFAQTPRSYVTTFCKLVYWLLDCWIGYLSSIRPAARRSRLVIFDRYLPDILVDPVRYRLPASAMNVAELFVKLAPKPDVYVLLDAPAEIVQRRKCEVSVSESRRQRAAYRILFQSFPSSVILDADCPVDEVTRNLASAISGFVRHSPKAKAVVLAKSEAD